MAAVSQSATALTPVSSSHGTGYPWDMHSEPLHDSNLPVDDENAYPSGRAAVTSQKGHPASYSGANTTPDPTSRKQSNGDARSDMRTRNPESGYLSPPHHDPKPTSIKESASPADSLLDLYDAKGRAAEDPHKRAAGEMQQDPETDDSKWIHRDKLAKIESEELQAAGIFLPRARERARSKSQNRSRRDHSQDKANGQGRAAGGGEQPAPRSRKNSAAVGEPRTPDAGSIPSWDLRLPEEIADSAGYFVANGGTRGTSRIPVAKLSPVPIPSEHLERDTLLVRKRDSSPTEEDQIAYPKTRTRSGSTGNALAKAPTNGTVSQHATQSAKRVDSSPKKGTTTTGARKPSGPKPANGAAGRPKTRGGPSKDSTSSGAGTTRPSTRSGELSPGTSSKQMEGEPPWMVSAYRPDPRLPPDQQLLPTVARRLQQEKWEKEGKFGSVYDKEFRPLTDEGFLKPPGNEDIGPEQEGEKDERQEEPDWPLKAETKPALPGRQGSYSTMPRITDKPTMSPLPSPRTPAQPPQPSPAIRLPEPPEEEPPQKKSGGGCGCCIVM